MRSTEVAVVLLSLWLGCLAVARCQVAPPPGESAMPDKASMNRLRWKTTGDDVMLLVRKVDEVHPYFMGVMFRKPSNDSDALAQLTSTLTDHCNITGNVTQLVKNDVLVLRSTDDVANLRSGDRVEIWSAESGAPTRAKTAMSFARPNWSSSKPKPPQTGGGGPMPGHHGGMGRPNKRGGRGPRRVVAASGVSDWIAALF